MGGDAWPASSPTFFGPPPSLPHRLGERHLLWDSLLPPNTRWVREGIRIPYAARVPAREARPYRGPLLEAFSLEVEHQLRLGILAPLEASNPVCNVVFPVPKSGGRVRLVISAKAANSFAQPHFKFVTKNNRVGIKTAFSMVEFLPEDLSHICPARHLLMVKDARKPDLPHDFLFYNNKDPPFKQLADGTLRRWVQDVLTAAGKDIKKFNAHSLRFLVRQKWLVCNVPRSEIRARANWAPPNAEEKSYSALNSGLSLSLLALTPLGDLSL